ncbi:N-succinylarginine dihydrolase [Sphingomonas montana]|uniref:N-succinylarginine dihydrolase n=1 Tax=Sphingomonas montana TaxID=1843236 RepID=UPI00096FF35A|nr:N-succinylarginine dihydrolase [Sphingomonas montana]
MIEVNFDGLIGPTHNYAGLAHGNLASAVNAGRTSAPRQAALQGLAKMRAMIALGLPQGVLLPHRRPDTDWLRSIGFSGSDPAVLAAAARDEPVLLANACSASAMWTANAATVSPSTDTSDGRCHLSVANLTTMRHRGIESVQTERQLRLAFADGRFFAVHGALPAAFRDEGAANFMRLTTPEGADAVEIFVYGEAGAGGFPARQDLTASQAIARRHGLAPSRTCFAQQSAAAIAVGAFHNDVVAVAHGHVLFAHEQAFADPIALHAFVRDRLPATRIVTVPAAEVSLATAIRSYLFNSQLVTLPSGDMALVLPQESRNEPTVWRWLEAEVARGGPIRRLIVVDVRESMRNGGGPACLRLRVQMSAAALATVDRRFLLDDAACDRIEAVVAAEWPVAIAPDDLGNPDLWLQCHRARAALLDALGFGPDAL